MNATDVNPPHPKKPSMEDVLDQRRFFNDHDQMVKYGLELYSRRIVEPKNYKFSIFCINWSLFPSAYFVSRDLKLCCIGISILCKLIKVFYSNLKITTN